ncbi:MAG: hypothetical protein FJZ01_00975 [Candidatus Sericytochromatia bacterium]|nr:hypothetical protein [Candidatus Tanganyikabacteria bacterium]
MTGGVFDLNGNVWEWTETVGAAQTTGSWVISDVTLAIPVPGSGFLSALATDSRLRRLGLPGATSENPTDSFGGDHWFIDGSISRKSVRGGIWNTGGNAGLWNVYLGLSRTDFGTGIGFRPALRF